MPNGFRPHIVLNSVVLANISNPHDLLNYCEGFLALLMHHQPPDPSARILLPPPRIASSSKAIKMLIEFTQRSVAVCLYVWLKRYENFSNYTAKCFWLTLGVLL